MAKQNYRKKANYLLRYVKKREEASLTIVNTKTSHRVESIGGFVIIADFLLLLLVRGRPKVLIDDVFAASSSSSTLLMNPYYYDHHHNCFDDVRNATAVTVID